VRPDGSWGTFRFHGNEAALQTLDCDEIVVVLTIPSEHDLIQGSVATGDLVPASKPERKESEQACIGSLDADGRNVRLPTVGSLGLLDRS
jgi:hypothetical protein